MCKRNMKIYIPYELLNTLPSITAPEIAWDGIGTIASAWDSCVLCCDIPNTHNLMCGGKGLRELTFLADGTTFSPTQAPPDEADSTSAPTSAPVETINVIVTAENGNSS